MVPRRKVRIPPWLLLLVLVAGGLCVLFYPLYVSNYAVPYSVVRQMPERVKRLRPGMTREEVREILGLTKSGCIWEGGGPGREHWESCRLWPDHGILLVFDYTSKPPRFKRAALHGKGWSR